MENSPGQKNVKIVEDSKPVSYSVRFIFLYTHTSKANNRLKQNGLLFPVFSAQRVWRIYCQQTRTLNTNILRNNFIFSRHTMLHLFNT